jgi:hypothetical protein
MSLKHKQKVYLSLSNNLLEFVENQSRILDMTKSKYITSLLLREYESYQRKRIDKIIEGL